MEPRASLEGCGGNVAVISSLRLDAAGFYRRRILADGLIEGRASVVLVLCAGVAVEEASYVEG